MSLMPSNSLRYRSDYPGDRSGPCLECAKLRAQLAECRKAALLEFAYKWLPNLRQKAPQSSLAQTEYNLAIDDAVKHALRMAEGKK